MSYLQTLFLKKKNNLIAALPEKVSPDEPDLLSELIDLFINDVAEQISLLENADAGKTQIVENAAHKQEEIAATSARVGLRQSPFSSKDNRPTLQRRAR